jgi:hypothetical protein
MWPWRWLGRCGLPDGVQDSPSCLSIRHDPEGLEANRGMAVPRQDDFLSCFRASYQVGQLSLGVCH